MATFNGTSGDDVLIGTTGADTINGNAGADLAFGDAGTDLMDGGIGDDVLLGGTGADTINGGDGVDVIADNDIFLDGVGNAFPIVDAFKDTLNGGAGDDFLLGGPSDVFNGGAGVDSAMIDLGAASGVTIDLTALNTGGTATLPSSGSITGVEGGIAIFFGAGANVATGSQFVEEFYGWTGNDTFDGAGGDDLLDGWSGNDALTGGDGADIALGGDGADTLSGGAGDDTLIGELGDDHIAGGAGNDTINGGGGVDTVSYADASSGVAVNLALTTAQDTLASGLDTITDVESVIGSGFADTLSAGASAGTLRGEAGDDTLTGGAGADTLQGGDGADVIAGGASADTLEGGDGDDALDGGEGDDSLDGGLGQNTLNGGAGRDTARFSTALAGLVIDLNLTTLQDTGGAGAQTLSQIENLVGSSFGDTLTGDGADNSLEGRGGDDTLRAGAGTDTLNGGDGVDTADYSLSAAGVIVSVSGFSSNVGDTLIDMENLTGSAFADTLNGSAGNNVLLGGEGADTISGGGGVDVLDGGAGADKIIVDLSASASNLVFSTQALTSAAGVTLSDGTFIRNFETFTLFLGSGNDNLVVDSALAGTSAVVGGGGVDRITADFSALNTRLDVTSIYITATGFQLNHSGIEEFHITGGSARDWLAGGSGSDVLNGGDGDDVISGQGGDMLYGGAGNDHLSTTLGEDYIDGGSGLDFVAMLATPGSTVENIVFSSHMEFGDADVDNAECFYIGLSGGDDALTLTPDYFFAPVPQHFRDANVYDGGAGVDRLVMDVTGYSQAIFVGFFGQQNLGFNGVRLDYIDVEEFYITGGSGNDNITGGSGADQLNGGAGADTLQGMGGNNVIHGGAGGDTIYGMFQFGSSGAGANSLYGDDGDDSIAGGDGNDLIDGGDGNDTMGGAAGVDQMAGGLGDDWMNGGDGGDTLQGGDGADTLIGAAGVDNLLGGLGNDIIQWTFGDGVDAIDGGADADTLAISDGNTANLLNASFDGAALTSVAGLSFANIEAVTANMGGGTDWLIYSAASAAVTVNLATGAASGFASVTGIERVIGGNNNDALTGDSLDNRLDGGAGDDALLGGGGIDIILGGEGADVIAGGLANDSLSGGIGNDAFNWAVGEGRDTIDGGADVDTFNAMGAGVAELGNATWDGSSITALMDNALSNIEAINLDLGGGVDWLIYNTAFAVTVDLSTNSASGFASVTNIEKVIGGSGGDTLTGDALDNRLDGQGGNDTLNGGAGSDAVLGGDGDDVIQASAGNDSLQGQGGNDTFHWTSTDGRDTFNGGADVDTVNLTGSAAAEVADTNWNGSTITGLLNNALIDIENVHLDLGDGGAGGDWLRYNTSFGISVDLGAGTATGFASIAGVENLIGGTGGDALIGDGGANKINGNAGDDVITGGAGGDNLTGGLGSDTFVYAAGAGADTVVDFDAWADGGQDFIDVRAFGINAGDFASRVTIIDSGADTVVRIDSDVFITMKNVTGDGDNVITMADFILA